MEIKKTSKRILTCTLAALMLAGAAVSMPAVIPQSSLTVSAAQTYGDFEYEVKNNKVIITKYIGEGGAVTIPSTINGKSVTSIGDYAFLDCNSLKTISIPNGVKSIEDDAFLNCNSLKTISIPDSVTNIGNSAFNNCNSLKTISIPDSVTSIGDDAFSFCESLETISIPDSVTSIGDGAFSDCKNLKTISIPNGVKSIGEGAFYGCESLKTISIPKGVKSIGEGAFYGCESLKTISIPDSVTSIGKCVLSNCRNLTNINVSSANKNYCTYDGVLYNKNKTTLICCPGAKSNVSIPDGVTTLSWLSFEGCSKITSIRLPDSVKNIEYASFWDCQSLTNINIPDKVSVIDRSTFYNCKNLKSINIPDSVTIIGPCAFCGCVNLKSVFIPKGVKQVGVYSFGFYEKSKSGNAEDIAKIDNFVIKGEKGSEAEKYAKANGFKFVAGAAPSSVTLNKTAMSLGKGETTKLTATVAPSNAADKTVTWRTSNSKVLTVDKNGNVKAAGTGTAWITAKTINGKEKSCKITVKSAPSKVTISKGTVTIGVGEKFTVGSAVPNGSAAAKRTYRTSNSSVVKMTRTDWQGDFVGVKPGTAYVTVKTYNGKESTCKVTVRSAPSSVTISKKAMTLKVGQTASLSCSVPSGSGCASRTFRTSNSSVVKMTKTNWTGSFKAVKPGVAYVTVRTYNGKESSCKITVTK